MLNEDRQFDLKIRSIMENGKEEVPEHVWDSVLERLSRTEPAPMPSHRRKPVLTWLRNTGIAVAAAAAVVAGVIFGGRHGSEDRFDVAGGARQMTALAGIPGEGGASGIGDLVPAGIPAPAPIAAPDRRASRHDISTGQINEDKPAAGLTSDAKDSASKGPENGLASEKVSAAGGNAINESENSLATGQTSDAEFPDDSNLMDAFSDGSGNGSGRVSLTISGNALSNNTKDGQGRISPMQSTGKNQSNVLREDQSTSFGIPLSFGAGVKVALTPKWALSAGLNYTLLTRTLSGTYYDGEGQAHSDSEIRNRQSYIGIPVNVYYNIVSRDFVEFYAYAGGTIEKCVKDAYDIDSLEGLLHYNGKSNGVQLSADIGIGVEFILARHLGLYIDPSLRYYFKSSQPKSIRTVQPLMLGFEAGLRIRL